MSRHNDVPHPAEEQISPQELELAQALETYLAALKAGQAPDPEQLLAQHPAIAERLRACLASLRLVEGGAASFAGPWAEASDSDGQSQILGDFRIVRQVGRGGMGVVYEAEQVSLRRRVALKVLPLAGGLDGTQLQRFQNEAQAAAGLHHSNIVPVYFVGCERGVHFYAMQFIDGQTLAELIRQLREAVAPGVGEGSEVATALYVPATTAGEVKGTACTQPAALLSTTTWARGREYFRAVAELGVQAAEALDYGHRVGVVHRDVKPGNLLLDTAGRVWVTDFGLAQVQGAESLTAPGELVGTLRYMSPEQALGKRVVIDHRTDIYSLGATLYELLTLRPAFGGSDRQELLRQIAFEEPLAPRRLERSIPAELETIVLKAMAKSPTERYATAQELAADLCRFLEDKPIQARQPSLFQKARKWARRHHTAVLSAAVVLLLASSALAAHTWLLWQEKEATKVALRQAEAKTRWARRAVDDMYTGVAEKWLANRPHMTEVKRQLLRKALDFYEELSKERSTDPEVQLQTAIAYGRLGAISEGLIGYTATAEGYLRQAERMARDLAEAFPAQAAYREEQVRATYVLGHALGAHARFDEAEAPLRRACSLADRLSKDFPEVPAYERQVGKCLVALAELLYRAHPEQAEEAYLKAAGIQRGLVDKFPKVLDYRYDLVETLDCRVGFLAASGRLEEPLACRQALADLEGVVRLCLQASSNRTKLGATYSAMGSLLTDLGQFQDAEKALDQALEIRRKCSDDYGEVAGSWPGLGFVQWKRARLLTLTGRTAEAEEGYIQAIKFHRKALGLSPGDFRRYELALMLGELGWYYLLGPARQEHACKALGIVQEALELAPDGGTFLQALRGLAYYRLGEWGQAITALEAARAGLENPQRSRGWTKADDTYLVQSARRKESAAPGLVLWLLAMSYHRQGDAAKAASYCQQAKSWCAEYRPAPQSAGALKAIEAEALALLGSEVPPRARQPSVPGRE
jgi:serine/threonine protein kinase